MDSVDRFLSWIEENWENRPLLCHFYYEPENNGKGTQKRYYTKVHYAYFNLFNRSKHWIIKGTTGCGIDTTTTVPVLNCYKVNSKFIKALRTPVEEWCADYELGLIIDRSSLEYEYGKTNVHDVGIFKYGDPKCESMPTWYLDKAIYRRGVLDPFNRCDVVRFKIRRSKDLGQPIKPLHSGLIKAVLVKRGKTETVSKLLEQKKWKDFEVFPVLPIQ